MRRGWLLLTVIAFGAQGSCSDEACTEIFGECVGVPVEPVCDDDACTEGIACANVLSVEDDGELDEALASAAPGDCIALAPGSYHGATVPAGVSLLGKDAGEVAIGAVALAAGSGSWVRGLEIEGGLDIGAATSVHVDAVRIVGGTYGVHAGAGASIVVERSEIEGAVEQAVLATDAARIDVSRSIIRGAGAGGLWVQCAAGCACAARPSANLDLVLVQSNANVGVFSSGADLGVRRVFVDNTLPGADFGPGGGLVATQCSNVVYASLLIQSGVASAGDHAPLSYGMLVDGASAAPFGSGTEEKGIVIIGGMPGVWIQGSPMSPEQSVVLDGLDIAGAYGAGLGFDLAAKGIVIIGGKVGNTMARIGPTEKRTYNIATDTWDVTYSQANVGIGFTWKGASSATIDGLEIGGSGTHSIIIDGPVGAGSEIVGATLTGGDETKGVVQQTVDDMDAAPELGAAAPALERTNELVTEVPAHIEAPVSVQ
jgi:hypothetical protein